VIFVTLFLSGHSLNIIQLIPHKISRKFVYNYANSSERKAENGAKQPCFFGCKNLKAKTCSKNKSNTLIQEKARQSAGDNPRIAVTENSVLGI